MLDVVSCIVWTQATSSWAMLTTFWALLLLFNHNHAGEFINCFECTLCHDLLQCPLSHVKTSITYATLVTYEANLGHYIWGHAYKRRWGRKKIRVWTFKGEHFNSDQVWISFCVYVYKLLLLLLYNSIVTLPDIVAGLTSAQMLMLLVQGLYLTALHVVLAMPVSTDSV